MVCNALLTKTRAHMFADINELKDGILPCQWLSVAAAEEIITGPYRIPESNYQPASLDLRLGEKAYRLRCSFLPDSRKVEEKLEDLTMGELDLRDGAILEKDRPYLIPLLEELKLPEYIHAKTNPKSSIGRLDIFTRVITDSSHKFDEIRAGYSGQLYLEVVSRSFTVKVQKELSLNQLRLIKGDASCDKDKVQAQHQKLPILRGGGGQPRDIGSGNRVSLSVNLQKDGWPISGWRAKKNSGLLDLVSGAQFEALEYWEPIEADSRERLILEPEEFYLLASEEAVCIDPMFAAEMTPYDPSSGEVRTHYAGFFDPGFGYGGKAGPHGVRAVMEVRAHDVPFMMEHGQKVCTLAFEEMLERPAKLYGAKIGSSYQGQGLTLSKYFLPPREIQGSFTNIPRS
jgi:dCTP deaminase